MAFSKITGKSIDVSTESIAEFNSTGIDDNATSTAITIAANNSVSIPSLYGNITTADNLTVGGDFIVQGNNFTIDADSLRVEDSLIQLASNNETSDVIDIGFFGHYSNDGNTALHTGFFRDASDEQYYLFNGLEDANLDANNSVTTINRGGTGFTLAALNVGGLNANGIFTIGDRGSATEELTIFHENNVSYLISDSSAGGGSKGEFSFRTNDGGTAAERMRIDGDGNVGIGVTSMVNPLHVGVTPNTTSKTSGSAFDGGALRLDGNLGSADSEVAILGGANDGLSSGIGFARQDGSTWGTQIRFYTHGTAITTTDELTERMRIDASGNVGIGTTSPSTKLHLGGTAPLDSIIRQDSTVSGTNWEIGERAAGKWQIWEDDGDSVVATFTSTGLVGIGTTSPSYKLDVDVGAPASNDQILGRFSSQAGIRSIAFLWDDSASTLGIGTQTNHALTFHINGSSAEKMRIDTSGNVGIGVSNPLNSLHINTGASSRVTTTDGTRELYSGIWASQPRIQAVNGTLEISSYGGYDIVFDTNGSEVMRINSSGNVLVGTPATPAAKVHINGTGDLLRLTSTNSSAGGAQIDLMHFSPSPADGDIHSYINFGGYYSGTTQAYGSSIRGAWNGVGAREGQIHFYTRKGATFTEKARINEDGHLLVGTTTSVGTGVEGIQIGTNVIITGRNQTSDQIHHIFKNPNGTVGTIRTLNNATSYVTSSDARLKENIVDAPAGNIDDIRVRSFDWKTDETHQTYGMVAQELVDVAPEAVSQGETEDDMWGVDYSKLVPMMIKEIQDLKAEVAALKGA